MDSWINKLLSKLNNRLLKLHELVSTEFNFKNENIEMIYFRIFDNHLSTLPVFQNVEIVLASCCLVERWVCRTHEIWGKNERVIQIVCYYVTNVIDYLTTKFCLVGYKVTTNSLSFYIPLKLAKQNFILTWTQFAYF